MKNDSHAVALMTLFVIGAGALLGPFFVTYAQDKNTDTPLSTNEDLVELVDACPPCLPCPPCPVMLEQQLPPPVEQEQVHEAIEDAFEAIERIEELEQQQEQRQEQTLED